MAKTSHNHAKLSNGKVEKDWSVKGRSSLSSPVCYDEKIKKYQAVIGNKAIHSWSDSDIDIEKSPKTKIPKAVETLLNTHLGPVLLYKDGTYAPSSDPNNVCGRELVVAATGDQVQLVTSRIEGKTTALVVLTASKEETQHTALTAHAYLFGQNVTQAHHITLPLNHAEKAWLSSTLISKDGEIHVLSLWSDGQLTLQSLSDASSLEDSFPPIRELDTSLASMAALDATQIAICGLRTSSGAEVGIWDMNFGVLKASTKIPNAGITKCKLHSFAANNKLVLQSDRSLFLATAVAPVSTLGNLLGACAIGSQRKAEPEVPSKEEEGDKTTATKPHQALCEAAERLLENPRGSAFTKAFVQFMDTYKQHSRYALLISKHITTLLERWSDKAKEDKNFKLPVAETKQLITSGLVTSSALPHLLSVLTSGRQAALVYLCCAHVRDIPEACLVRMLSFFLTCEDNIIAEAASDVGLKVTEKQPNSQDTTTDVTSCPLSKHKAAFLNDLLRLPVNDLFLVDQLRTLSYKSALDLLKYLHYLLVVSESAVDSMPTIQQTTDWLSCVLDAHFTQLVLSQDARLLLAEMHQTVATRIEVIEEMNIIEALMTRLKERMEMPQRNKTIGHYCIETLHI